LSSLRFHTGPGQRQGSDSILVVQSRQGSTVPVLAIRQPALTLIDGKLPVPKRERRIQNVLVSLYYIAYF